MFDVKDRWNDITDRERWAARGAAFVAKVKATKAVWFSPAPVETGAKAASAAKKTTTKTAKKTAKKTANGTRSANKTAKKTTGAAKKATGAKKTSSAAAS